jgi:hypothetical protein
MQTNKELTQGTSENGELEEEWKVILQSKGEYMLSKKQARVVSEAIASGSRGIILFETFSISIPYIVEFYRVRQYRKSKLSPLIISKLREKPTYNPIVSGEKLKEYRKKIMEAINKREEK